MTDTYSGAKRSTPNGLWLIVALIAIVAVVLYLRSSGSSTGFHPPEKRKPVGSMVLDTLDGKPWKIEDHAGKVVVMNFWATWCPPCVRETPALVRIANKYTGNDFAMVGISFDEGPPDQVVDFVAKYNMPYPIARPTVRTPTIQAIQAIPVTMLLDRKGNVARRWVGEIAEAELAADIDRVLAEP